MANSVFNSVADLQQLGNFVVDGYAQSNAGLMPDHLAGELEMLTDRLVEGMEIQHERLKDCKETPQNQAECELYMDMHRRYKDKIPSYSQKAKGLGLEDY